MNNAPIAFVLQAILTSTRQRILAVKVAKTLPQGREARREQFGRTEKIFREDSKAFCGIGGGLGVNTGGAFAYQIYLILNVVHRGVEIVLPAGNFTQRDKRHAAGPVAVPRIKLMRHFMHHKVKA